MPKSLCVIGDPIAHSLSPVMHRAAFACLGEPHKYEAVLVSRGELPTFVDRVRRGEFSGFNVTIPHKVDVMSLCDVVDDCARDVGAVNTVFVEPGGALVGANTDIDGFRLDLAQNHVNPETALVLGTGGAARAIVSSLLAMGVAVWIAGRSPEKAIALASEFGVGAIPWMAAGDVTDPIDLVVNTTSAGMAGADPGFNVAKAFEKARKSDQAVAYDIVYRPHAGRAQTPLIEMARSHDFRAFDGRGMLVQQGAEALKHFLQREIGRDVRDAMARALHAALGN
jgi:shikimate dehydrogenase